MTPFPLLVLRSDLMMSEDLRLPVETGLVVLEMTSRIPQIPWVVTDDTVMLIDMAKGSSEHCKA